MEVEKGVHLVDVILAHRGVFLLKVRKRVIINEQQK
jgi:hypothetical protein